MVEEIQILNWKNVSQGYMLVSPCSPLALNSILHIVEAWKIVV